MAGLGRAGAGARCAAPEGNEALATLRLGGNQARPCGWGNRARPARLMHVYN